MDPHLMRFAVGMISAVVCLLTSSDYAPSRAGRGTLPASDPSPLAALAAAVGTSRPIQARVTGGFQWGPYVGRQDKGPEATHDRRTRIAILIASDALRRRAAEAPEDPSTLAALGIASLVTRETAKAIDLLEHARDRNPLDATVLNDLAATYLTRGLDEHSPEDVARALDAAEASTTRDPALREAWFNRALALEHQNLRERARAAWLDYLTHDAASPWASEARARLDALQTPAMPVSRAALVRHAAGDSSATTLAALSRDVTPAREYVDGELLPAWATRVMSGASPPAGTIDTLRQAERVAAAVLSIGGDAQLRDTVAGLLERASSAPRDVPKIARAVDELRRARLSIDRADGQAALTLLDRAWDGLRTMPGLGLHVRLQRLVAQVQSGGRSEFLPDIERLAAEASRKGYVYLEGRAHLLKGVILLRQAAFADTLTAFERATVRFRQAKEHQFLATALTYTAEALGELGDHAGAWIHQVEAFGLLDVVTDPRRRHSVLVPAGLVSLQHGLAGAALHVQAAALENARQWNVPASHVAVRVQMARSLALLGKRADARSTLAEARVWVERIADAAVRAGYAIELSLAEGDIASAEDPRTAVAAYSEALRGLEAIRSRFRLPRVYLKRGRAFANAGDWVSAELDWRTGLEIVDQELRTLRNDDQRIAHLDGIWDLYGALIELMGIRRGDAEGALRLAEQGRARTLLDAIGARGSRPGTAPVWAGLASRADASGPSSATTSPRTPSGTAAVVYAALEQRLIIWVVSSDAVHMASVDVPRATLQRLVTSLRQAVLDGRAYHSLVRRLYVTTWAPIADRLRDRESVVIVPDGPLAALPFAALGDETTALIERHALSFAPSLATIDLAARRLASARAPGPAARALIAADPAFDRATYPYLSNLGEAVVEARAIAALYPASSVIAGADVTKARLRAALPEVDVLHFAGHAVSNQSHPDQSHLVLAASGDDRTGGRLYPADIVTLPLDTIRLVLLSACQTGVGRTMRGEGTLSLARPFLAAGIPTVIGTLWDVEDVEARTMMVDLHRALQAGEAPDVALQRLQVARLQAERTNSSPASTRPFRPGAWAGFVVIGAVRPAFTSDCRGAACR